MDTIQVAKTIVRPVFVVLNTVVCGFGLCLTALSLSGQMPGVGGWGNAVLLLSVSVTGINLVALFPEFGASRDLRRLAYAANLLVVAVGFFMIGSGSVHCAIGGVPPESFICWAFGTANTLAVAMTGE